MRLYRSIASSLFSFAQPLGAGLLALLILLFYMEVRWAYMIGIFAPAGWLVLAFATGLLGAASRQLLSLGRGHGLTNLVSFLAASPWRSSLR